jgi:hypothetical protein
MFKRKLKVLVCATIGLVFGAGQASAAVTYHNGEVQYYFMNANADGTNFTFVNVSGTFCYRTSTNTGFATIFAAKQITGSSVRIACDGYELVQVQQ